MVYTAINRMRLAVDLPAASTLAFIVHGRIQAVAIYDLPYKFLIYHHA
jgi:hypothetical protein